MPKKHGVDLNAAYGGHADKKLQKLLDSGELPAHVKIKTSKGVTNWLTGVVHQVEGKSALIITHTGGVLVDALGAYGVHLRGDHHELGVKDPSVVIESGHIVCVPDDNYGGPSRFVHYGDLQAATA